MWMFHVNLSVFCRRQKYIFFSFHFTIIIIWPREFKPRTSLFGINEFYFSVWMKPVKNFIQTHDDDNHNRYLIVEKIFWIFRLKIIQILNEFNFKSALFQTLLRVFLLTNLSKFTNFHPVFFGFFSEKFHLLPFVLFPVQLFWHCLSVCVCLLKYSNSNVFFLFLLAQFYYQ